MFGSIKNWLGIEGLKIEFDVEDIIKPLTGEINGSLLFYSKREQLVESVTIKLIERYTRGRRKNKLIDEYILGEMDYAHDILVPPEQFIELEFSLPFEVLKSDMDKLSDLNFLTRGLVEAAKKIKNAKSEYRLEATANVKGVAVNPFVKKILYID